MPYLEYLTLVLDMHGSSMSNVKLLESITTWDQTVAAMSYVNKVITNLTSLVASQLLEW